MKVLSLEFDTSDLQLKAEGEAGIPKSMELTKRIIIVAVRQYADQQRGGVMKLERNQSKWLYENLEKAAACEDKTIEIPDDVFGFLRKVFRETPLPPMDKILDRVEANIDAVKVG